LPPAQAALRAGILPEACLAQSVSKPNVKRHKSDVVDAEAICEAVTKANKRFGQ
jgi:hypothetical protein